MSFTKVLSKDEVLKRFTDLRNKDFIRSERLDDDVILSKIRGNNGCVRVGELAVLMGFSVRAARRRLRLLWLDGLLYRERFSRVGVQGSPFHVYFSKEDE